MVVKVSTPLGSFTVSGKKSVLNALGMALFESAAYNKQIGADFTSANLHSQAHQIHVALSDVGYYDCVRSASKSD